MFDWIDLLDCAEVPIEHVLLVVVLGLNDLVPGLESPSEPLNGGVHQGGPDSEQSEVPCSTHGP
jgi:hypothetical protein